MTTTDNIRAALGDLGLPADRFTDEDILELVERINVRLAALAAATAADTENGQHKVTLEPAQLMAVIRSVAEEMLDE